MENTELQKFIGKKVAYKNLTYKFISAEKGVAKIQDEDGAILTCTTEALKSPTKITGPFYSLEDKPIVTEVIRLCLTKTALMQGIGRKQKYGTFRGYNKKGSVRVQWDNTKYIDSIHPSFVGRASLVKDN